MDTVHDTPPTAPRTGLRSLALGGVAGLLSGAAAVAASEAVTALMSGVTSPILSVGNRAVDWAPRPLKEFAIETFGTADKPVLIGSVVATVALLAIVAGALGVRRPRVAYGMFLALSAVAALAALTDRAATAGPLARLVPVAALVVVGLVSLRILLGAIRASEASGLKPAADHPMAAPEGEAAPSRRGFLVGAASVAAFAAVSGVIARAYGGLAATASRAGITLPGAATPAPTLADGVVLDVDGMTPYITPNRDFYRVDTALQIPDVPIDTWRLRIHGMVDRELEFTFADLVERDLVESRVTLTCVSNPVGGDLMGNATWLGVPLHELLAEAGVQEGADAIKSTSADDWTCGTPLSALTDPERGALLAVGMNGEPLPLEHGFPARLIVPGLYGYVSATKWVVDLEVTRFADFEAYWTSRGYSAEAPIKTASRIDVPGSFARVKRGRVPIAGVAWSQARGIDKVEVRIDGGAWQQATLAGEDNINTWRQWLYQWDAQETGNHFIEVRATDRTGYTQTSKRAPIAPDGATGWNNVQVTVV